MEKNRQRGARMTIAEVNLGSCELTMPVIGMGTATSPPLPPETTKAASLKQSK